MTDTNLSFLFVHLRSQLKRAVLSESGTSPPPLRVGSIALNAFTAGDWNDKIVQALIQEVMPQHMVDVREVVQVRPLLVVFDILAPLVPSIDKPNSFEIRTHALRQVPQNLAGHFTCALLHLEITVYSDRT